MASHSVTIAMPSMLLADDYIVKFEAVSPTTEAPIAGVNVSQSVLFGDGTTNERAVPLGPYMFVPGPTPV